MTIQAEIRSPKRISAEIGALKILPAVYTEEDEGKVVSDGELISQTAHAPVTENGVVDTTLNNSVSVNVPNTYSASDEGKVVYNSRLVPQTPHAMVTSNGRIDTTINNSVEIAVPTPSGTKSISIDENGTFTEDVYDYSTAEIEVNVPNTYAPSDEGKVVSGGSLVAQTPHETVVENGTVDTTLNDSVQVSVPASAVDVGSKSITQNGEHDVVGYAVANVAVPASEVDSGSKAITRNGTHNVVGYAEAEVAVPNSYSQDDEGKVVYSGALRTQTAHSPITANGTVDTTLNNSVTVMVPQPSGTKSITLEHNGTTTENVKDYVSAEITVDVPASEVDVGTKAISSNGTHDVVGYASASVNVPNTYTESDEGKVVDDGELVSQTPHATVTNNGTIDTTKNNSVEVAVPASAVDSGSKPITRNGTHDVVGYASAEVAVPNTYSQGDEGKVVYGGALRSQTAHTPITANGTVDTTLNNSVQVIVPQPSGTKNISITQNGTTTENVKDYVNAEIAVNVPNTYTASDEGKVVDDGALVSQTAHSQVTQNGTIDTTLNNSVEVAVPASAVDTGTKSISTNGTHDVIGYASAQVNVPNSYSASDEGKVVSNGALIAQVAHALVTANGIIDTTLNNSVEIAVPSGGIEFPSDWFVDSWTQASDSQSKTWTHGLGQMPHFVVCICLDSSYGSNGRICDYAFAKSDGTWVISGVTSANSNETSIYGSQSIGYNGYEINATTITLTQGRYYSATFKQGKKYLLLAHK